MKFDFSVILFLTGGVFFFYFFGSKLYSFLKLKYLGEKTTGYIKGLGHPNKKNIKNRTLLPYIEFTVNSTTYSGIPRNSVYTTITRYAVGKKVTLYYDKKNPEKFALDHIKEHLISGGLLILGILIFVTYLLMRMRAGEEVLAVVI